jgi:hypothetical protein
MHLSDRAGVRCCKLGENRTSRFVASASRPSIRVRATYADHVSFSRREIGLSSLVLPLIAHASSALLLPPEASAIQGLTAGRIPGLSSVADEKGFYQYMRPEGKSGGHGVGWSEIPRYGFKVPKGWEEIPVSIADLGGTEIDLRYTSKEQGELAVVVAPVLRFVDVGFNANIRIQDIGEPMKLIQGFGPELYGKPIDDEDILDAKMEERGGLTYYTFETRPHNLCAMTAYRNRLFILSLRSSALQWKKAKSDLLAIQKTFEVRVA